MPILASLQGLNLFSSLPSQNDHRRSSSPPPPKPPIPIPRYPPPPPKPHRRRQNSDPPAFKAPHRRSSYYRPVTEGPIPAAGTGGGPSDDGRAVVIGKSGVSYRLPGAPFDFQFSYSETPKAKPLAIREPAFLPFAPPTMPRPWTGKAPLKTAKEKKLRRKIPLVYGSPPEVEEEVEEKVMVMPAPFTYGRYPRPGRTREDILGEPLKKWEITTMVRPYIKDNRQVNLGRDGLTHNMLELIHSHWRRMEICKIRCKGVPTVDMTNVCRHIEDKTGGKIVYRAGGSVYVFRGRNYNYATRPQYPVMLWKPATPVYPKLIQDAPGGLTKKEADEMRLKGKNLLPICTLAKNGVYISLVRDARIAFEGSPLVKIDCKGLNPSDYKKIGAKLMELVPCVLLSFDDEQILMWRGSDWKSKFNMSPTTEDDFSSNFDSSGDGIDDGEDRTTTRTSPKMLSLWKRAIDSNKAILLDEIKLGPDALLKKVEEFERVSQAIEHSYPVSFVSREDGSNASIAEFEEDGSQRRYGSDGLNKQKNYDDRDFADDYDEDGDDLYYDSDSLPMGSLPIDKIANNINRNNMI